MIYPPDNSCSPARLNIRLLGSVEAHLDGQPLPLGPPQRRLVLAALATDAGRAVAVDTLLDRVWDRPPDGARHALHVQLARLRRALRDHAPIVHRSGAYVLDVDPNQIDVHCFRHLLRPHLPGERLTALRRARELWSGEPLTGLPGRWASGQRHAWRQHFLDAEVAWAAAELATGDPATVVGRLTELASAHPTVEPLHAALIRALATVGRIGDAVTHYTRTRRHLVDELGLEPGPELRALHRDVLRGEFGAPPAPAAVPAQLPPGIPGLTGRGDELEELDTMLGGGGSAVAIATLSGTAGVGKTALAVHWAHRAAARFPDGQLYLDLRGYDPGPPMPATDALVRLLATLGEPASGIPGDLEARAARYRTLTARRRMLVLLDNAENEAQVRPLLPGAGTCAVLVTSRNRLAGLVARDGARRLTLDPLRPGDADALLRRLIGSRADAEPDACAMLAACCAGLPLALRITAELVAARPAAGLAGLAGELTGARQPLDWLTVGDDPYTAVPAVFSWSIRRLPPDISHAFRLLSTHAGPVLDAPAAAALTGADLPRAQHLLNRLADAHLLQPTGQDGYVMHRLLRAYGALLAGPYEPLAGRRPADLPKTISARR
ncbi:DNA-binding SARP family transcriptional activator [Catenuloplanes nepalensis]|uniref:DNA-binding SARP family transcriptional activator n=1 Tax=Catenuloplanes nepalensis TaxID=587533 RepID=A0ABT9MQU2_9ACTN|nr:BTAD domain-containing putative transcriptional regulator [Catenuloplanes nepalensis]MDP9793797.1 DNA-binding SARP family transcriptional activator [Catenuloplanes nepalensis]